MGNPPVTIVLADDDDGHATLVRRILERAGLTNKLIRVHNGQQALDLMRGDDRYVGELPDGPILLVLDVKMPLVDGTEVLRQVKTDPDLSCIPVFMFTTTDDPREVEKCYQLGCNLYITKPVGDEAFVDAINRLGHFLQIVRVPDPRVI